MEDLELDDQRVIKSFRVDSGGLFGSKKIDVEYEPLKFEFINKTTIICNACSGSGKQTSPYGGLMNCRFCDGKGTLKLNRPVKEL